MQRLGFIYNLQTPTWQEAFRAGLRPRSYLLAPNNATPANRRLAAAARTERRLLLADNGNFVLISGIKAEFTAEAGVLRKEVEALEGVLGRSARNDDVGAVLRGRYRDLAMRVRERAEQAVPDPNHIRASQHELAPTHIVGVESLVMAAWLSLDIEPEYLEWSRSTYRVMNAQVARIAKRLDVPEDAYSVASAVSYDTAYDAGKVFAEAGIKRVAMGFGAYTRDTQYTDHLRIGRRIIPLGARIPRRNVRMPAVARGFAEGYVSVAGVHPVGFHCLGLGTPKLMAAAALALWGVQELTFDATSPMRDAAEGTLYVTKPAHQGVRTRKVALRLSTDPSIRWDCPCPFCTAFMARHPFNYTAAARWAARTEPSEVTADDLRPGGALYLALPLLSEPLGGPLRAAVTFARMGHNHWAIDRLLTTLRPAMRNREKLRARVEGVVSDYQTGSATNPGEAARIAYLIAAGEAPFA